MGGENSTHDEKEERVLCEILFQRKGGENHIWKRRREKYTREKERCEQIILHEEGSNSKGEMRKCSFDNSSIFVRDEGKRNNA